MNVARITLATARVLSGAPPAAPDFPKPSDRATSDRSPSERAIRHGHLGAARGNDLAELCFELWSGSFGTLREGQGREQKRQHGSSYGRAI